LDSAIAQSEVWCQQIAHSESLSPNNKMTSILADLWSQSKFRTQWKYEQKTDPQSEM